MMLCFGNTEHHTNVPSDLFDLTLSEAWSVVSFHFCLLGFAGGYFSWHKSELPGVTSCL